MEADIKIEILAESQIDTKFQSEVLHQDLQSGQEYLRYKKIQRRFQMRISLERALLCAAPHS